MPSFDILSAADMPEVNNALDQTRREIATRFDFKGSKASVELEKDTIVLMADDNMKLSSVQDILKTKLSKRGVSLKSIDFQEPKAAGGDMLRQEIKVKQGLTDEEIKKINKAIKTQKTKVSSQAQEDKIRVSGKKIDDLQTTIAFLKGEFKNMDLQFQNFRD